MTRILLALPFAFALASCGDKAEKAPANDTRNAEGEVLGGTISDAMLPLDSVKSQSPPLRESPSDAAGEDEGDSAEKATASPSPSPSPTPEDGA